MKTKNMRKKALLSSLAMLLVAVIALGGATYAWFSTNAVATATGVSVTSGQSTSLQFATTGTAYGAASGWGSNVDIDDTNITVLPVSSTDGKNFYKVSIGDSAPSEADTPVTGIVSATYGSTDKDYYKADFTSKCTTADYLQVTGINFPQGSTNEFGDLLRVSITIGNESTGETKVFYGGANPFGDDSSNPNVVKTLNGTSASLSGVTFATLYNGTAQGVALATPTFCVAGTDSATSTFATPYTVGQTMDIFVKVWLEGNVAACNNSMMAKTVEGMVISFSTTTTAPSP